MILCYPSGQRDLVILEDQGDLWDQQDLGCPHRLWLLLDQEDPGGLDVLANQLGLLCLLSLALQESQLDPVGPGDLLLLSAQVHPGLQEGLFHLGNRVFLLVHLFLRYLEARDHPLHLLSLQHREVLARQEDQEGRDGHVHL